MFPRQLLYLESWALPRNTLLLCFTSLPELQRLGKSTGVSLSTGRRTKSLVVVKEAMTEKIRLCLSAHRPVRESKPWAHLPKQPYIWFFLLMHNVTLNTISCADHSGGAYLQGCDVFQPNGAIFILLAHTHHSWLQDFTGLQNEHLKKREQTEFRFQQN